ncbi:MAG: phosphatidylserine decarboxylase family protein [bacterium]|nr:phosphatidylserine decarboxylase family protein [bacterium]
MLKFRKEGVFYIIISGLMILFFFLLGIKYSNILFFLFSILMIFPTAFIAYFFRDPERKPESVSEKSYISPADGKVLIVDQVLEEIYFKKPMLKISIFMSVFDVHVNRSPFDGKVKKIIYQPGLFLPAFKDVTSVKNERVDFLISGKVYETRVSLISGIIARRIVPFVQTNHNLHQSERIGMIKFGSRVDCYLSPEYQASVKVGEKVFAGKTVLASLK